MAHQAPLNHSREITGERTNHCHGALNDDNAVDAWSSPAKSEWSPPMHRSAPTRRVKGVLKGSVGSAVQRVKKFLSNL